MITYTDSNRSLFEILTSPLTRFAQALSSGEDYWTWTTSDKQVFEDVEILGVDRDEVRIRHKYGVASLLKTKLSETVQKTLRSNLEYVGSYENKGFALSQAPL